MKFCLPTSILRISYYLYLNKLSGTYFSNILENAETLSISIHAWLLRIHLWYLLCRMSTEIPIEPFCFKVLVRVTVLGITSLFCRGPWYGKNFREGVLVTTSTHLKYVGIINKELLHSPILMCEFSIYLFFSGDTSAKNISVSLSIYTDLVFNIIFFQKWNNCF